MARSNLHHQPHSRVRVAKVRAIQAALERTGLSPYQLARLAGVGHDIIYRLINNSGRDVTLGSWERIERLLIRLDISYQPKAVRIRKRVTPEK